LLKRRNTFRDGRASKKIFDVEHKSRSAVHAKALGIVIKLELGLELELKLELVVG
jgi:hypothetical protein